MSVNNPLYDVFFFGNGFSICKGISLRLICSPVNTILLCIKLSTFANVSRVSSLFGFY